MAVKIVVLDDGETWGGPGQVLTITDEAHGRLCSGEEIKDLTSDDILVTEEIG